MNKCIVCDNEALKTAAVCNFHLTNPANLKEEDASPSTPLPEQGKNTNYTTPLIHGYTLPEQGGFNELCRQVYELTGWRDESFGGLIPAYTSDYLLEKLGDSGFGRITVGFSKAASKSFATYQDSWDSDEDIETHSDTPLKALLKLCLALKEATHDTK